MSMAGVNLIPQPRRQAAAARKRIRRWSWTAAGYGLLLLGSYAACSVAMSAQGDDHALLLEKTTRQIEELTHTAASLKPQLADVRTKLAVARTVGDQPDWSLLLAVISSTVDDDIVLTSTTLDAATIGESRPASRPTANTKDPNFEPPAIMTVSVQGLARSQAAMTLFVLRLEKLGLFDRVELAKSNRQAVGAVEANVFQVDCELRRSGKPLGISGDRNP
jgi:Tfp pilus assembly protein PilN